MTPAEQLMKVLTPVKDAGSRKGTPSQKSKLWMQITSFASLIGSHLVVVCIFYEHAYCFISLSLSPVKPGADVDTQEKYMGLNILTWNIARVNSEESPA